MEYVIPVLLTLSLVYIIIVSTTKQRFKNLNNVMYSQSAMHSRTRYFMPNSFVEKQKIISQADKHINKNMIKIIVVDNKAYWIAENMFYVADVENGNIISDTVKQIDTSKMSEDELDKMLKIVDNLNSGGL